LPFYTEVEYQKLQIYGDKADQKALQKLLAKEALENPVKYDRFAIQNRTFESSELLYLNSPPKYKYGYLKEQSLLKKPDKFIAPIHDVGTIGKFKGIAPTEYKPLNQEDMMKKIQDKKNGQIPIEAQKLDPRCIAHLSKSRGKGGRSTQPSRIIEDVRQMLKEHKQRIGV
jgi:hypothetical protein